MKNSAQQFAEWCGEMAKLANDVVAYNHGRIEHLSHARFAILLAMNENDFGELHNRAQELRRALAFARLSPAAKHARRRAGRAVTVVDPDRPSRAYAAAHRFVQSPRMASNLLAQSWERAVLAWDRGGRPWPPAP